MSFVHAFDASAVIRLRSSHGSSHDASCDAFSLTLTTPALNRRSSGLFEASPVGRLRRACLHLFQSYDTSQTSWFVLYLVAHAVVRQRMRDSGPAGVLPPSERRAHGDASEEPLPTGGAPLWLAVIILANATLVHLMSPDLVISAEHYTLLTKFVCLFFLIYLGVKSETDLKIALWTLLLGAAYIGYEVTINERGNLTGGRLEGVGAAGVQTSNELAALLVTLLPLLGPGSATEPTTYEDRGRK